MKKLLLSLGALSAVVAPVAAVVACGSKTETPSVSTKNVETIANAFATSLDVINLTPQTQTEKDNAFNQFIGYVSDVVNGTHDGHYLHGAINNAADITKIVKATGISTEKLAAAKTDFNALNVAFTSQQTKYGTVDAMQEANNIDATAKTTLLNGLDAMNAKYPQVFKAALLLQIGHVNLGTISQGELNKWYTNRPDVEHALLTAQINEGLKAAGFAEVAKADFIGAKTLGNSPDAATQKDVYKNGATAYVDAHSLLNELIKIAAL